MSLYKEIYERDLKKGNILCMLSAEYNTFIIGEIYNITETHILIRKIYSDEPDIVPKFGIRKSNICGKYPVVKVIHKYDNTIDLHQIKQEYPEYFI